MVNLTNYLYQNYQSDKTTGITLASLVGISLVVWILQSIQERFQPRRLIILLLLAHLTIFIELILRVVLCRNTRKSKAPFVISTILLAICQRVILVGNNVFLIHANDPKSRRSRLILVISILIVALSGILLGLASALSNKIHTINSSFRLRQVASIMILCKAIAFYPLWFITRTGTSTTIFAILLLSISSISSLIIAVFLLIISFPNYYQIVSGDESWFYYFQLIPMAFILCTWSILHPKRSLTPISSMKETLMENIDNRL